MGGKNGRRLGTRDWTFTFRKAVVNLKSPVSTSDDVANESDAGPWACSKCTYLHEKADEWGYLACNMCGAPKPNAPMPDGA